ncbi:MAG: sigma 54-interacting transcriptional regulator [Myxococcales bacterium]|nr:sigma 54-interacting transcriptional regulator [Myxococcales bacterium]
MRLADRYRLLRRVGEGGGGGVFLVEDRLAGDALMVLKRLNAQAHVTLSQWLVNEFQVLAQLDLPTVAPVFDFGLASADAEDPGGTFFTRAFVDGVPLDDAVTTLDAPRLRRLFRSAAETLRELHRIGVVHGDLKPANLIVPTGADHVVLIDFGLAHGAMGAPSHVRGGTLGFMPPERQAMLLAGESLPPDPRADVYALAVSLRVVLSGGTLLPPGAPLPPAVAADDELRALWALAERGAAEHPARRFATMDDLLAALGDTADGSPPSLRPPSMPSRVVLRPEGREPELGALLDAVARRLVRRDGSLAAVAVVGEEGSGRSTLLREVAWRAQLRGVQTLRLQGEAGEGPLRRLREGAAVLSGRPIAANAPEDLTAALREAARVAPVLVLADDLDRADPAVRALLRSVAYACEADEALLVIATATSAESIAALEATVRVDLGPLDQAAVAALCTQTLGAVEPAVVVAVRRRSGGLPLAVHELLDALARSGAVSPADVEAAEFSGRARDAVARRLAALPAPVVDAVAVVAMLGGEATPERVGAALDDEQALADARRGGALGREPDGRWSLARGAVESTVRAAAGEARWAAVARRVAEALEAQRAPVTLRATAWLRAGEAARARALSADAVAALRREGLPMAAVTLLCALREADPAGADADARYEEAELLHEAGLMPQAEAMALEVAGREGDAGLRATLLYGRLRRLAGDLDVAEVWLTRAHAAAASAAPDLAAEALTEAARVSVARGDHATAVARCEAAMAGAATPRARAGAQSLGGLALVLAGDARRGSAWLEEAREVYATLALPREEATLLAYLAIAREREGDLAGARALHERSLERARAAGDLRAMVTARINVGQVAQRLGDLGASLENDQAALRLAQRSGLKPAVINARLNMASQLIRIGSLDRARVELDAVLLLARETQAHELAAAATLMLGVTRARGGEVDAGLALMAEAEARFEALGQADDAADAGLDAAEALLDRGDVERAREALGRSTRRGELGLRACRAALLEARCLLAGGRAREAMARATAAITEAEAQRDWEVLSQALAVRAQALVETGAELHARKDRERALEVLEEKAMLLPPDLRGAFWGVTRRASLRASLNGVAPGASEIVIDPQAVKRATAMGLRGATVNGPTLMANDERLLLLLDLSRRLGEENGLERVLDQAVRSAVELTNAERGALLLAGDGALVLRARVGPRQGDGPDDVVSRSIADTVWIDGEPVVTLDAKGDRRFAEFRSVHELGVTAVAGVPMRFRGRVVGVLLVESRRRKVAWAASDVSLMLAFAEQAAIAVEHQRVVGELEARTGELETARRTLESLLESRTGELEATRTSLVRAQEALTRRFAPAGVIAGTEPMRRLFALVERVRDADVPVVIEGESGTGKELVARAIHHSGLRARGPFVVVHCGAIPESLLESELFGHVRGAFTGADRDRKGLIASANGGTLMLDEVGEMSPRMQVELLRVLQERRVRPVGAEQDEAVDARVIAATQRPLVELTQEGRIREDLFYRLSVVTLRVPPLRERVEDIPALAAHFLAGFAEAQGGARKRLSREAMTRLLGADWPGNVRQLRHVLESASVLADGPVIEADALALPRAAAPLVSAAVTAAVTPGPAAGGAFTAVRKASERQRIVDALEQVNWNKVRAAGVLGMPRRTLYRRLKEYGLLDE